MTEPSDDHSRALRSATTQPIHSIVLVDDHSEDDTVDRARRVVRTGLTVRASGFMRCPGAIVRLVERGYVPTIGVFGFRTSTLRAVGYDRAFHGAEDYDVVLLVSALERRPEYADARINLASPNESRITTHPLRHHAARADYQPA